MVQWRMARGNDRRHPRDNCQRQREEAMKILSMQEHQMGTLKKQNTRILDSQKWMKDQLMAKDK